MQLRTDYLTWDNITLPAGVVLALLNLTFHLKGGKSQKNHLLSSKGPGAPFHSIPAMKISVKYNLRSGKDPPAAQISSK